MAFFLVLVGLALSLLVYTISKARASKGEQRLAVKNTLGIASLESKKFVGFFHPYCNAGGGGERVLWTAIALMQRSEPDVVSVVYSGDIEASKEQIIDKVKARFAITLHPESLHFVFLHSRRFVEDATWPRFTLLGQSIGSMYLGWEAMSKFVPDVYIDTMGYAFTFHVVAWLTGVNIGAYVHYPTISTDMLARVQSRRASHTNSGAISSSAVLSTGKLLYYRLFMYHYAMALRRASFLMVNSSWTKNHVDAILTHSDPLLDALHLPLTVCGEIFSAALGIFGLPPSPVPRALKEAVTVYPPCDTREMSLFSLEGRERIIVSVAQFRPEKDHATQIQALSWLLRKYPEHRTDGPRAVRLVLIGGSRNKDDTDRVSALTSLAESLSIREYVQIAVNLPYPDMLAYLSRASVGLSTMVDEHFGINIVEMMAAGVVPVAHASGGPLNDIIVPVDGQPTGFHATDAEGFADAIHETLTLTPTAEIALRQRARDWAISRFSEREFERGWEGSGWRNWL
ncbi:mannosyltransferase [Artomyces pyxidatus]|uniref:Mannosyltransferase n=1 Tax=Artomyces pyxidatus TaxID=48021 RepID=A0ACB8TEJ0_9AGAM|nr:mannosyltransferase [Artomyces pyxidatus]